MTTFLNLIHFYQNPCVNVDENMAFGKKIAVFILLMLKCYLCILAFLLIYTCILSFIGANISEELSNGVGSSLNKLGKYALLYGALIGPLCEEILFRLPLNMKKINILLSLFIALPYTYAAIFSKGYISIPVFLTITSLLIYILSNYSLIEQNHLRQNKINKLLIWSSVIFFTIIHLENIIGLNISNISIGILQNTPILITAIYLTYIRCKLGFKYSLLMHIFNNSLLFINGIQ